MFAEVMLSPNRKADENKITKFTRPINGYANERG